MKFPRALRHARREPALSGLHRTLIQRRNTVTDGFIGGRPGDHDLGKPPRTAPRTDAAVSGVPEGSALGGRKARGFISCAGSESSRVYRAPKAFMVVWTSPRFFLKAHKNPGD